MIDNKYLRRSLNTVVANLSRRGHHFDSEHYQDLENKRRQLQINRDELLAERNRLSASMKTCPADQRERQLERASVIKRNLAEIDEDFTQVRTQQDDFLLGVPNLLDGEVPDGGDESQNRLLYENGVRPEFSFEPKNHFELCRHDMDFAGAAKISGSRFVVLHGVLARLQRVLTQWMLDEHIGQNGYREVYVPYIVDSASLVGTGQLPKFADDLFRVDSQRQQYLIPTAEVSLTNLVRDSILEASELPLRLVAHSPCFRSEAGSYGKDTSGMIRQHQFDKVELVQICHPDHSATALQELRGHAEAILKKLGLAYRVMHLCAGDTGFAAASTYDLEVWLPGQQRYREISSCSTFTDFQSRRASIRFRERTDDKPQLAHTINGSGLAVGRTLIALLENYQTGDGSMTVPEVLQARMGGLKKIELR